MGWTSTGDPYANVGEAALSFDSEEAAKAFAEKHGWDYVVCFFFCFSFFPELDIAILNADELGILTLNADECG